MNSANTDTPVADRPMRADARRNRERILAAATAAFGDHGQFTQMDDVAMRAGVGVGTVYRHFPTKEVLLAELVRQKFVLITEHAEEALAQEGDPFEVFGSMIERIHERFESDAAGQDAIMRVQSEWSPEVIAQKEILNGIVQELIDRAQAAGSMRPDFAAQDMGMLMCGISSTMSHGGPGFDWRRHMQILLDGLRAR